MTQEVMRNEMALAGIAIYEPAGGPTMRAKDVARYYRHWKKSQNQKKEAPMNTPAPAPVDPKPAQKVTSTKPETTAAPKTTTAQRLAADAERLIGYYTLYTNAKGHVYIRDNESKQTLAKVRTCKHGVYLMPRTDMIDALPDRGWEYHPGWASKFCLTLPDMTAVWAVLDEYWLAKEAALAK